MLESLSVCIEMLEPIFEEVIYMFSHSVLLKLGFQKVNSSGQVLVLLYFLDEFLQSS